MFPLMTRLFCACLVVQYVSASKLRTKSITGKQDGPELSALHEVVGRDGVLLIEVERANRKSETNPKLNEVGIYPTIFPAVDVEDASPDTLRDGCLVKDEPACGSKAGVGCGHAVEQAIAESHRQALLKAESRNATWTAILEDDAVPVDPTEFNANFKKVWAQIPPETGLVRLGWCVLTHGKHSANSTSDSFFLLSGHMLGGCTTAYMVRRDFVRTVLGVFPCCAALDACFAWDLFLWPPNCGEEDTGKCWAQKYVMGIDAADSEKLTDGWTGFAQRGILAQDNRISHSIKSQDWMERQKSLRQQESYSGLLKK